MSKKTASWPAKHPWNLLPRGGLHPYVPPKRRDWVRNPPRGPRGYLDGDGNEWVHGTVPARPAPTTIFIGTFNIRTAAIPMLLLMEVSTTGQTIFLEEATAMSVVLESQAGDRLYCVLGFSASPRGEPFSWDTCRSFEVGEPVTYVNWYRDEHFRDHPVGWMVVFDAVDGKRYAATQSYFVTEDCWKGLQNFFTGSAREKRKRRKTPGQGF